MAHLFGQRGQEDREQSPSDELLSAYLDDELSAGERARLEARLATDPALQAELEALCRTVAMVHELPPVPSPRNFILPQTMAVRPRPVKERPRRRAWAAPLLTAATALVSLLFVVVLVGDLLLPSTGRLALAPADAPAEAQMDGEAPEEPVEMAQAPSPVVEEAEREEIDGAIPPTTPTTVPTEAPLVAPPEPADEYEEENGEERMEEQPTPEKPEEEIGATGGGATAEPGSPAPTPSPPVAEEAPEGPPPTPLAEAEEGIPAPTPGDLAEVPPPEEQGGVVAGEEAEDERGASEDERVPVVERIPWRTLEIALGLSALALVAATILAWRARRR